MTTPKLTHRILAPVAGNAGGDVDAPSAPRLAVGGFDGAWDDHALVGRCRR